MDNALGLIGIAKRAGKIAIGDEACSIAVRDRVARAILTASDASARVIEYAQNCEIAHIPLPACKAELGALLGRASVAQIVILDIGIAASIAEKLSSANPTLSDVCTLLSEQAARALKRKKKKQSRKG